MSAHDTASIGDWRSGISERHFISKTATSDVWEQEEVSRSAVEARQTTIRPTNFRRYAAPTADTAYPLEYAFHLFGNLLNNVIVDLGCGSGENIPILATRSAHVTGIDISPQLLQVAAERLRLTDTKAELRQASAYDTGFRAESVDAIFCIAILHHLDLARARREVRRILRPGGVLIAIEPVRDSKSYARLRNVIPLRRTDISSFERPLTSSDINEFTTGFEKSGCRRFRLPFIPLLALFNLGPVPGAWRLDRKLLQMLPFLRHYASVEVFKLTKTAKFSC